VTNTTTMTAEERVAALEAKMAEVLALLKAHLESCPTASTVAA
jgi:hypothetical protein